LKYIFEFRFSNIIELNILVKGGWIMAGKERWIYDSIRILCEKIDLMLMSDLVKMRWVIIVIFIISLITIIILKIYKMIIQL
jgi:hypothetical protein